MVPCVELEEQMFIALPHKLEHEFKPLHCWWTTRLSCPLKVCPMVLLNLLWCDMQSLNISMLRYGSCVISW
jgi:hypothetical protein